MFVVSVHSEGKNDPTVHIEECLFYQNRQQDDLQWYGPYPRFTDAWKVCFQHAQSQNRIPQKHSCVEAL